MTTYASKFVSLKASPRIIRNILKGDRCMSIEEPKTGKSSNIKYSTDLNTSSFPNFVVMGSLPKT